MITSQAQRLYGRARLAALGVEVAVVRACWVQGKPLECSVVAALEYLEPPRSLLLPCSQAVLLMIAILHYLQDPKLWEIWYTPYSVVMHDVYHQPYGTTFQIDFREPGALFLAP